MAKRKMTTCKHCGQEIAKSAKTCPACGGKNKKPIYKRIWFWVLVLFVIFLLLPGGDDSSSTKKVVSSDQAKESTATSVSGETTEVTEETSETEEATTESKKEDSSKVTIKEKVLLDKKDIKITATEYVEDVVWGDGINLTIENNTKQNICVGCNALIVNNYHIYDLFAQEVAAGKKANEIIYLSSSELRAAGIDTVGQIEIDFHIFDDDTWDPIIRSEMATIKTSQYKNMDVTVLDEGEELYNQDGIRIVGKTVDEDSFWGAAVLFFMENTSGRDVEIQVDNLSVNGYMIDHIFSATVYDGKMAIDAMELLSEDLEKNHIESIDDVELSFHIFNPDTFDTIKDTDIIKFSAK